MTHSKKCTVVKEAINLSPMRQHADKLRQEKRQRIEDEKKVIEKKALEEHYERKRQTEQEEREARDNKNRLNQERQKAEQVREEQSQQILDEKAARAKKALEEIYERKRLREEGDKAQASKNSVNEKQKLQPVTVTSGGGCVLIVLSLLFGTLSLLGASFSALHYLLLMLNR